MSVEVAPSPNIQNEPVIPADVLLKWMEVPRHTLVALEVKFGAALYTFMAMGLVYVAAHPKLSITVVDAV
jgi:hypothetical protein